MLSSINTPVRWYNIYFESERFSNDCDPDFELISDKTRLLPFQFRRPKSSYLISRWFLRKECEDPMVPLIDKNNSLFTLDTGYWAKSNFAFTNGKLKSSGVIAQLDKLFVFVDTEFYGVKIVVNDLKVAGSFTITAVSNFRTIATITGPGTYYLQFKANATDEDFSIVCSFGNIADYVSIEEIQIYEYQKFNTAIGDIDLPTSLLSLINLSHTQDLIQYCGNNLPFQIPCGKYYMIITYGIDSICYSELLTVKDFIPSQSPFTMLEWTNSCNLADIIYQPISKCNYKNRLYVDSELSKPEYPFKEDGEEDGEYKLNILFKKWEKTSALMFAKCPEFMVDALTGIRLHDTIQLTKPLRKKQFEVLAPFEVEKVEYENASIFNDCSTNVELKILLKDHAIKSNCCETITLPTCIQCQYTVDSLDTLTGEYYFGTYGGDFGLFHVVDGIYENISGKDTIVCVTDTGFTYLNLNGEYWTTVPAFSTATTENNNSYTISGYVHQYTFLRITIGFFDEFNTPISFITLPTVYTAAEFFSGINILKSDVNFPCPLFGKASISVESFDLYCNYGTSDNFIFDYALHPLLQTWYDALTVKPSCELLFDLNTLIKGLDTDGNLAEFDLLHTLAGMETDEQRLLPLFSSSSNVFSTVNTITLDENGVQGNGVDSCIDLNWNPKFNATKYLQDDCSIGIKSKNPIAYNGAGIGSTESTTNSKSVIKFIDFSGLSIVSSYLNSNGTGSPTNVGQNNLVSIIRNNNTTYDLKYGPGTYTFLELSINPLNMANDMAIGALNNDSGLSDFSPATYQFVYIGSGSVNHVQINTRLNAYLTSRGLS